MGQIVREPPIADDVVADGAVGLVVERDGRPDHRDGEQPGGAIARPAHDQHEPQAQVQHAEQRLERHSGAVVGPVRCVRHSVGDLRPTRCVRPFESMLAVRHTDRHGPRTVVGEADLPLQVGIVRLTSASTSPARGDEPERRPVLTRTTDAREHRRLPGAAEYHETMRASWLWFSNWIVTSLSASSASSA